jgi:hypothetical protein
MQGRGGSWKCVGLGSVLGEKPLSPGGSAKLVVMSER